VTSLSTPVGVRIGARGLTRRYGSVVANDRVDLAVAPGTIHSIVGGNGAGKSTLMRILQGVDGPDEGSVILNDEPVHLSGPADAFARGVGMVHQEFMLAAPLTLLENLILAREPVRSSGLINWRAAEAEAERLAAMAGVKIDWRLTARDAPIHVRQILEILRLLYRGAGVLILDEPTAVLAPSQIEELLRLMQRLKAEGRTLLFISHKLDEVLKCSDAITVMRGGRVVANTTAAATDADALARAMVGEAVAQPKITPRMPVAGQLLFSVRGLKVRDPMGFERLGPVDLDIRPGEIVGVAGVGGNGQDELVACAAGVLAPAAGAISFAGDELQGAPTARFRDVGIGYLSADRAREGLCLPASLTDNFIAGRENHHHFSKLGLLRPAAIRDQTAGALKRLAVRYGALSDPAASLSGGNQQRLAIARELARSPKLLVASQPTRGVDIAGTAFIHNLLAAFRDEGGAVLLVSEALDELLTLADRIICLFNGTVVGELARSMANVESVGRLMLGRKSAG
jgi:general nucleoside transport system ATP-binding protein